jgi:murein L,D-transpeptidase YcbB/YkuD
MPMGKKGDTSVSKEIRLQLDAYSGQQILDFPKSVRRFYRQNGFEPVWIKSQTDTKKAWEAVLILNCVLQFGLCHNDYHPKELSYSNLHIVLERPSQVNPNEKARYDIMITDALITFMNNLHFGKLNPDLTAEKIDDRAIDGFYAKDVLANALGQADFLNAITAVQPQIKDYKELQESMRNLTQYQEDCDSLPNKTVQKMAINLERLRWLNTNSSIFLQINIPSYTLSVELPDTAIRFRAIVGGPTTPTPTVTSFITDFTTASELKIPQKRYAVNTDLSGLTNPKGVIYFWFKNKYGLSLIGRPERDLFTHQERALSHGSIKVEQGEKLAALLLNQDGSADKIKALQDAVSGYVIQNFILNKPVILRITYLTCGVQNGILMNYKDIYDLDKELEMAFYNISGQ